MMKYVLCLALLLLCGLSACAGREVEVRPKGQMVLGGSVGN